MPPRACRRMRLFVSPLRLVVLCTLLLGVTGPSLPAQELSPLTASANGLLVDKSCHPRGQVQSENGRYWCRFRVAAAGDEVRQLVDFALYEDERLLWGMSAVAPGSDLYISNAGLVAFVVHDRHWAGEIALLFYSQDGHRLMSLACKGASLFGFSAQGNLFGVCSAAGLQVVAPAAGQVTTLEAALQFDFSEDETLVALANPGHVAVKKGPTTLFEAPTGLASPRAVRVSRRDSLVAVIDRQVLRAFSLATGRCLFADTLRGTATFRDLRIVEGKIVAGIQVREQGALRGVVRVLDAAGRVVREEYGERLVPPQGGARQAVPKSTGDGIPWPFAPFDSMRTVWNYYEQHMGYDSSSYLHQGLDLITSIREPVYAVEPGIVKCVLTLGGSAYWRLAIAPQQVAEPSVGWLYAHLIKESIACAPGDTVALHQYLGQIVRWGDDWGHIHFVQIQDSGLVWRYDDGEWGICGNPLLSLRPNTDTIRPQILDVFPESKFGICLNESSVYLRPDSVYGAVDFVVRVVDLIGDSLYELPAFEVFYWIVSVDRGDLVVCRRLAQRLNHAYPFYGPAHYEEYATLIYKRDAVLPPPAWGPRTRAFFHLLTNSDGDDQLDLSEHQLAFVTTEVPDGRYRIHVLARDLANSVRDSMDFTVANFPTRIERPAVPQELALALEEPCPNPFNASTRVTYTIPREGEVELAVFDVAGRQVKRLVGGRHGPGRFSALFDAKELTSGMYFLVLRLGGQSVRKKCVLVR